MSARPAILLVDDDRYWLETLGEYLQAKGFQVETAEYAAQALELISRPWVAIAIVDYHLGPHDGLQLVAELRRRRDVPILVVSGDDEALLGSQARAAGAAAYVPKTATPRFLLHAIQQALGPRSTTAA